MILSVGELLLKFHHLVCFGWTRILTAYHPPPEPSVLVRQPTYHSLSPGAREKTSQ